MNRLQRLFVIIVILIVMCLLLIQIRQTTNIAKPLDRRKNIKKILYWTPMFQKLDFNLGLGSKIFENCTYSNCYTTWNKSEIPIEEFDAIAFHAVEYRQDKFGKPTSRNPGQIYIFSNQESPENSPRLDKKFNSFYNWTMTYRLDSDILRPYGFVEKTKTNYQPPSVEEIQRRPKLIAWFVSNCQTSSGREVLYNKLKKYLPIDVYGTCGNLTCSKANSEQCYHLIENNYKFYLSFENSICQDYVSEKLYNLLKRNIVPIVYSGANYTIIAPPNSVIDVMKFKTLKRFVKYLKYLDKNPREYLKFFEWKKNYIVDTSNRLALCTLCRKLNEKIQPKIYNDISKWWNGENFGKCGNNVNFWL